jgi:hypothetical protein
LATVEEIKQEIHDWYADPEEPLIAAFTAFVHQLCYRRSEITLPSGIAKLWGIEETQVIFYVGETLYAAHKDRDRLLDDGTVIVADWQVDDLYEVKLVNNTITEAVPTDSTGAI